MLPEESERRFLWDFFLLAAVRALAFSQGSHLPPPSLSSLRSPPRCFESYFDLEADEFVVFLEVIELFFLYANLGVRFGEVQCFAGVW